MTVVESDHPAVLVGTDHAPTPVEYLLHAIAACLTSGIANIAAARGVELHSVRSTVEGDIDLLGILGLSGDTVRNGYEADPGLLRDRGRRGRRDPARPRRAVAPPFGRVRRAHQPDARRHRRGRPLTGVQPGRTSTRLRPPSATSRHPILEGLHMPTIDTVVIGAGHAGLAVSRLLTEAGVEHVVLDRGQVAERWRTERWDSLHLLTPAWMTRLPHFRAAGVDPDAFLSAGAFVEHLEQYAASFDAPVVTGAGVQQLARTDTGYRVQSRRRFMARPPRRDRDRTSRAAAARPPVSTRHGY